MTVKDMVGRNVAWLAEDVLHQGVGISVRVRLARNLRGERFPDWMEPSDRRRVFEHVRGFLQNAAVLENPSVLALNALAPTDREVLIERHLITPELAGRDEGAGLALSEDESESIMINEEDHLRIQVVRPGMNMAAVWQRADRIDSALEQGLDFAFHPTFGYLTSCPSNLGTGLRASVMLHLLGLRLTGEIDAALKALDRLGLAVRGVGGEGSDASGNMFQISNQETLGASEHDIIAGLQEMIDEVARQEYNARLRVMEEAPRVMLDCMARALAILKNARMLQSEEAVDYLSALRLGVAMGMVRGVTVKRLNALMLLLQPGHLQRAESRDLSADDRDILRADITRRQLARTELIENA